MRLHTWLPPPSVGRSLYGKREERRICRPMSGTFRIRHPGCWIICAVVARASLRRRLLGDRTGVTKLSNEGRTRAFACAEILDFCQQGYWAVLPYALVRQWVNLRVSPQDVVPQRDCRPRLNVDYTFSGGVNGDTVALASREAMQFGKALQRVMHRIVRSNPRYGPVYLSKIDIVDGFYRVWLQLFDILKLRVALPTSPGAPQLIAFLPALPMCWVQSPLFHRAD